MKLNHITLINFRNFPYQEIDFDPSWNLFYGPNAQGKTNLLEGIYLAAHGISFKGVPDREMIRFGQRSAYVKATIEEREKIKEVEIKLSKVDRKRIRINEVEVENRKELSSQFEVVFFSPQDLFLVKGGPSLRRLFLDELIQNIDPLYRKELRIYEQVLFQRNQLLKQPADGWFERQLDVFDEQMAEAASPLFLKRKYGAFLLEKYADYALQKLSSGKERLELFYLSGFGDPEEEERKKRKRTERIFKSMDFSTFTQNPEYLGTIKSLFHDRILKARAKDESLGFSQYGPHKDDFVLLINGLSTRKFASQGQVRTLTLALKLAELKIIERAKKTRPILLLDDVFSELDRRRSADLLKAIYPYQTMLTSNEPFLEKGTFHPKGKSKLMGVFQGRVVEKEPGREK